MADWDTCTRYPPETQNTATTSSQSTAGGPRNGRLLPPTGVLGCAEETSNNRRHLRRFAKRLCYVRRRGRRDQDESKATGFVGNRANAGRANKPPPHRTHRGFAAPLEALSESWPMSCQAFRHRPGGVVQMGCRMRDRSVKSADQVRQASPSS